MVPIVDGSFLGQFLYFFLYTVSIAAVVLSLVFWWHGKNGGFLSVNRLILTISITGVMISLQIFLGALGFLEELELPLRSGIIMVMNIMILLGLSGVLDNYLWVLHFHVPFPGKVSKRRCLISSFIWIFASINCAGQVLVTVSPDSNWLNAAGGLMSAWGVWGACVLGCGFLWLLVGMFKRKVNQSAELFFFLFSLVIIAGIVLLVLLVEPYVAIVPAAMFVLLLAFSSASLLQLSRTMGTKKAQSNIAFKEIASLLHQYGLSPREAEIACLLAEGKTYKEISAKLFVSVSTVQTHVTRIYTKMNVNSKTGLSNLVNLLTRPSPE